MPHMQFPRPHMAPKENSHYAYIEHSAFPNRSPEARARAEHNGHQCPRAGAKKSSRSSDLPTRRKPLDRIFFQIHTVRSKSSIPSKFEVGLRAFQLQIWRHTENIQPRTGRIFKRTPKRKPEKNGKPLVPVPGSSWIALSWKRLFCCGIRRSSIARDRKLWDHCA